MSRRVTSLMLLTMVLTFAAACGKKDPALPPAPNPFPNAGGASSSGGGPTPQPPAPPPVPGDDGVTSRSLTADARTTSELNGPNSPLQPVYFLYDSDEITDEGKKVLASNAELLKTNRTWVITVEGHCDERGSAEYNLALGDRRALAARNYLVTLGIGAERLRTVSYGKEFPFNTGHDEAAWKNNRRAHFMVTSK